MEHFIPDGRTSQEAAMQELNESDIIIFLVSPYYGSLIKECKIGECKNNCSIDDVNRLSYTHCEFKFAISANKPHQSYIIEKDWGIVEKLKDLTKIDWKCVVDNKEIFNGKSSQEIEHYFSIAKQALEFKKEVRKELSPSINDTYDVDIITKDLGFNIPNWYFKDKIRLRDFCGRKEELIDVINKMGESVEIFGVGGVGKTTLIQVALLIQKLKGKRIIAIGTNQSYLTGSGYKYFRDKCKKDRYEILRNLITIDDIINALSLPEDLRSKNLEEKAAMISSFLEKENILLFIDDFHLADNDVYYLAKNIKRDFVIATKKRIDVARNQIELFGIDKRNRDNLIDLICHRLNKTIGETARDKIKEISEGHPVSTELLVRNSEKINFEKLFTYKEGFDSSKAEYADEMLKRVIEDILDPAALDLAKKLSILNKDVENNICAECIKNIDPKAFNKLIYGLIDTGMLKKKDGKEGIYQFSYSHIQNVLVQDDIRYHKWAIEYYKSKTSLANVDRVEILFHKSSVETKGDYIKEFIRLADELEATDYSFKRLIDVGEKLRSRLSRKSKSNAELMLRLAYIYGSLSWIENSKEVALEALKVYKNLFLRNKNLDYVLKMAIGLAFLGNIYSSIGLFVEAEKAYNDALDRYSKIDISNNDGLLANVARIHLNKGLLFTKAEKYDDSANEFAKVIQQYDFLDKTHPKNQSIIVLAYIGIGRLLIENSRVEEGMNCLKYVGENTIMPPRSRSSYFYALAKGYEKQQNPQEAAKHYLSASANDFILFKKGANILNNVISFLENAKSLGEGTTKVMRLRLRPQSLPKPFPIDMWIKCLT